jgi:hypothetical protein
MKCSKCQFENPEGSNFCLKFGGKVEMQCLQDSALQTPGATRLCGSVRRCVVVLATLQPKVEFEGKALNVIDHLAWIESSIGHLRVKQGNETEVSPLFL